MWEEKCCGGGKKSRADREGRENPLASSNGGVVKRLCLEERIAGEIRGPSREQCKGEPPDRLGVAGCELPRRGTVRREADGENERRDQEFAETVSTPARDRLEGERRARQRGFFRTRCLTSLLPRGEVAAMMRAALAGPISGMWHVSFTSPSLPVVPR